MDNPTRTNEPTTTVRPIFSRSSQAVARATFTVLILLFVLISVSFAFPRLMPWFAVDWRDFFRPALTELLAGHNPYDTPGFYSPIWVFLPMLPFVGLPLYLGGAAMFLIGLAGFAYAAYRMGLSNRALVLLVLSPHVLKFALNGNVEWMVAVGLVLPPEIGIFFLMAKPQLGIGVALYWFVKLVRERNWRRLAVVFLPITGITLASFIPFGFWPGHFTDVAARDYNIVPWPMFIPLGLVALVYALRKDQPRAAILASPFLSPYMAVFSWPVVLLGLAPLEAELLAGVAGLWLLQLVTGYPF